MTCNQEVRNHFFSLTYDQFFKQYLCYGDVKFSKVEI